MPKLAIYVPKKEMRAIDAWRKKINFSQVFMRALQEEIARQSRRTAPLPADRLTAAAEHYRQQLQETEGAVQEHGFSCGQADVLECRLPAPSIREVIGLAEGDPEVCQQVFELLGPQAKEVEAFAASLGHTDQTAPTWRDAFCRGYQEGVESAWRQVCARMTESASPQSEE